MEFQHILLPVDLSKPCEQIVLWVVEMVKRMRARLTLLNVWQSPYSRSGEIDPCHQLVNTFRKVRDRTFAADAQLRTFCC
jgi:Universal stress protein family